MLFGALFFEPMPRALEAQTVIKTYCLSLTIPTCWRIGESKKPGVLQNEPKQHNQEPKQNQNTNKTTQEDTQETR